MPTTTNFALPYPAGTVTPDVPFDLQQLAAAIDATLGGIPVTATALTNFNTVANITAVKRRDGKYSVSVYIQGIRTASTLSISATAYTASLGVLLSAATYRPAQVTYLVGSLVISSGNTQEPCIVAFGTDGTVTIRGTAARTMASSGTDFFTVSGTWVTP